MLNKIVKVGLVDKKVVRNEQRGRIEITLTYNILIYDRTTKQIEKKQESRKVYALGTYWDVNTICSQLAEVLREIHKDNKIQIKAQYEE